ncbi:MAG: polyribonucleotide nucleotidyltransferase [Alphaproteobacteria bacterium 40-19]|nr:MAG: polyribonucleotide nucleotidyltransferase [Alphaproteobacteria bacterium 40-19]
MESSQLVFQTHRKEINWAGLPLSLETGKIARRASGAVLVTYGETVVLCTVCFGHKEERAGFLPLMVLYQEKTSAAGKIPGGFLKREGKSSEDEILISRFIDRTVRPLFHENFRREVQLICTVLSFDPAADPAIAAMIGTSAVLAISGLPIKGPIGGVRVGMADGSFVINPALTRNTQLDLVIGAIPEGVVMAEAQCPEITEDTLLQALEFGHKALDPVFDLIQEFKKAAGHPEIAPSSGFDIALVDLIKERTNEAFNTCLHESCSVSRNAKLETLLAEIKSGLLDKKYEDEAVNQVFYDVWKKRFVDHVLSEKKRLDARGPFEIRPIACEAGILPRTHGSALFTRGQTQALVTATLGSGQDDAQTMDGLRGLYKSKFLLHYNFPPYSVGEIGKMTGPGRREIGHGNLAARAIQPVLPTSMPYAIRLVSEITESYGSSSMATVCGASQALMDAGIQIKAPVAGIAMGLVFCAENPDQSVILSDISGTEDFLGAMDFKVAGTSDGITALQIDLKIHSLPFSLIRKILTQAKEGRDAIMSAMLKRGLKAPRASLSPYAPCVTSTRIPVDKIRTLIGTGGKNIREICESTRSKIEIQEDGEVLIFSQTRSDLEKALKKIQMISQVPEVGSVYEGVIQKVTDFGAFVTFGFQQDGLVHVSEISKERVQSPGDVLSVGDQVKVRYLGADLKGRLKLSIRQA